MDSVKVEVHDNEFVVIARSEGYSTPAYLTLDQLKELYNRIHELLHEQKDN